MSVRLRAGESRAAAAQRHPLRRSPGWHGLAAVSIRCYCCLLAIALVLLSSCGDDTQPQVAGLTPKASAFLSGWAEALPGASVRDGWPTKIRRTRDGATMVLIPAGEFQMGESAEDMARLIEQSEPIASQETPRHTVVLTQHYYMDVHELTVARWEDFLHSTAYKAKRRPVAHDSPDEPARGLAYEDAVAYANWVGCSLPTEAQWERAARGGEAGLFYPWGASDDISQRNGAGPDDGFEDVAPVGSFPPNPYGLFDMSGNVEEWCSDWYDARYYSHSPLTDPTGPGKSWGHVVRGGNYWAGSSGLTVSCRGGNRDVIDLTGCRLCRAVVD